MRLPPLPPALLNPAQKLVFDDVSSNFEPVMKGVLPKQADGALAGPFNPMVHFPEFGKPMWEYTKALAINSTLPKVVREIAVLVAAARFRCRYEIYTHERVALKAGLSAAKVATVAAGERPGDMTEQEGLAHDVAAVLTRGAQLPESLYQAALTSFGDSGLAELIHSIGLYCLVSIVLNGYDTPVPERG
jgi:4-carboxymuconolactone decarboxylase